LATGFPSNHNAAPELFVDAVGVLPALLVEAFTGTELQLLRQFDGKWHEVRGEPGVDGRRGFSIIVPTAAASRAVEDARVAGSTGGRCGLWASGRHKSAVL
jgi:hypothetical protein